MNKFVEQVLGHLAMIWKVVMMPDMVGDDTISANNCERWNAGHAERIQVIAAEKNNGVWLGFIQHFPQLPHRTNAGLRLFRNLVRRPGQKMRRMTHAECCNDFARGLAP